MTTLTPPPRTEPFRLGNSRRHETRQKLTVDGLQIEDAVIVALKGEAGFQEVSTLQYHLGQLLGRGLALVLLDLSELRFIASVALGVLVGFRRALLRGGGRLKLTGLRPQVLEAFRRTRLDDLFEIRDCSVPGLGRLE